MLGCVVERKAGPQILRGPTPAENINHQAGPQVHLYRIPIDLIQCLTGPDYMAYSLLGKHRRGRSK